MKNAKILLILSSLGLLASCGGTPSSSGSTPSSESSSSSASASSSSEQSKSSEQSQSSSAESSSSSSQQSSSSSSEPELEDYAIKVIAPTGVNYQLSKNRAHKGEEVTLSIVDLPASMTIKEVTINNAVATGNNGVYAFTMPDRSVTIKISVDVSGDVTLIGDIAAALEKEGDIYVARNVKVEGSDYAYFSYAITGEDQKRVILDSTDLDEFRCFANVTFAYGHDYELQIAGGFTYDFFYDPASDYPCYIRRVSVDYLPSSETGLANLFDGSMRSESTVNYPDLKSINYSVLDTEDSENTIKLNSEYRVYDNNVTFAKIDDVLTEDTYYSYKNYDESAGLLKLVDTYTPVMGNNDRTRLSANKYGAYAAMFDVIDTKDEDSLTRSQISARDARWTASHTAHIAKQLEEEIMYSYRVGFSRDELTSSKIDISSTKEGDSIVTKIDSYAEYNANAGTYTIDIHEAHVFKVTIAFDLTGRVTSLDFAKNVFNKSQWDFSAHAPQLGQTGKKVKTIKATCTYGAPESGAPEFDPSPYFISEISDIRFYDPDTLAPEDDGNSYLHYNDKVTLNRTSENDKNPNLAAFTYAPVTALDGWQYGPTKSSDESVIARTSSDLSYVMTCVSMGKSTVTFGNYTKSSGAHFDEEINVLATKKFHSVYLYSAWGSYASVGVETSESANVYAGQADTSFRVAVTPDSAPITYDAQSSNEDLLKIVDQSTGLPGTGKVACGEKLTLDTTGAAGITKATKVTVTITSDWFQEGTGPKVFTFTIIPAAIDVTGTTWNHAEFGSHVQIDFTKQAYEGEGYDYIGTITDDGYNPTTMDYDLGELNATFAYRYSKGYVSAMLLSISFNPNTEGWSTEAYNYLIDFVYDAENDNIGLFLGEWEYDDYYEDYAYYAIYGEVDEDYQPYSYERFARAN